MAHGEFTKEEAAETEKTVQKIMKAMSRELSLNLIGHFNDIFLFLAAAKKAAPAEVKK